MKNKCYGVVISLYKHLKSNEIFSCVQFTNSEKSAIALAMQSEQVAKFLLEGYSISSTSAIDFDPTITPINSDSECIVIREFSGEPRQLHIDLRNNYTESYKRDLQAFLSKYYPILQPIYPEFVS
jgi:hypothetical protein